MQIRSLSGFLKDKRRYSLRLKGCNPDSRDKASYKIDKFLQYEKPYLIKRMAVINKYHEDPEEENGVSAVTLAEEIAWADRRKFLVEYLPKLIARKEDAWEQLSRMKKQIAARVVEISRVESEITGGSGCYEDDEPDENGKVWMTALDKAYEDLFCYDY